MDRAEYKAKIEEIRGLIDSGRTDEAYDALLAENWKKVPNVNIMMQAGELYAACQKYDEAKELLVMAHERSPIGRMIIYRLALVCVELGELDEAGEYYDEFVEIAPHDSLKYIIRYQIARAKGSDDLTLISILEELKGVDFVEEWAFELAALYRKTSQADKCIDLCDEIILWFGEGPYVEKALEMKMLYHPLDKAQEDKYRQIQQKRDGITEIRPGEEFGSSEILHHPIQIPEVAVSNDRFNTINLQAEIKKNIEEIMQATEEADVSENMEAIRGLVEDFPYLHLQPDEKSDPEEDKQATQELDESIKNSFQEYLTTGYDGQIKLILPETPVVEEQPIEGQLTIADAMAQWEKTAAAAAAALEEARQKKFEQTKAKALEEANYIMDRLEDVTPKLDAGMTPQELIREEILSKEPEPEEPETEEALPEVAEEPETDGQDTFKIPRIEDGVETGVGLEIPVVVPPPEAVTPEPWEPQTLDGADSPDEAAEPEVEDTEAEVTEAAGDEITEEPEASEDIEDTETGDTLPEAEEPEDAEPAEEDTPAEEESVSEMDKAVQLVSDLNDMLQEEIDRLEGDEIPNEADAEKEKDIYLGNTIDLEKAVADVAAEIKKEVEESENTELVLSEEEKEVFSYFTPIVGMEKTLSRVLNRTRAKLLGEEKSAATGNVLIYGGGGSGKTTMAMNLIKVLQKETGRLSGNVGRIDGSKLNEKDIQKLFAAVSGGSLIVENAGNISRDTSVTMALLMQQDTSGMLVILEDTRSHLDRMLNANGQFASMFTEKISIPVMTIDELVDFGRTYASELGYGIDDMGVLAMYDKINLCGRADHPTYLTEVKEIVDRAIDHVERAGLGGFFGRLGSKHYDEAGRLILREKDFMD
ncbi:MAG: hypothetical protein K6B14_04955 [Lachnospiraceae bacterium]|nr:hypothetical protein [Lachnospiraceae bacterium]